MKMVMANAVVVRDLALLLDAEQLVAGTVALDYFLSEGGDEGLDVEILDGAQRLFGELKLALEMRERRALLMRELGVSDLDAATREIVEALSSDAELPGVDRAKIKNVLVSRHDAKCECGSAPIDADIALLVALQMIRESMRLN